MSLFFIEYYIIFPYIIFLMNIWFLFFKVNSYLIKKRFVANDKLRKFNFSRTFSNRIFIYYSLIYIYIIIFNFTIFKGNISFFWWQHLFIDNTNINILIITFFMALLTIYSMYFYTRSYKKVNYNFFFSLANLIICLTLLFFSNTLFTFFFLIETMSLLMFYKLSSSRFINYSLQSTLSKLKNKPYSFITKSYLNMIFFSYWTAFFSSVFFVYSIINLTLYFGTTEWFLINHILRTSSLFIYKDYFIVFYSLAILILVAFLLKTGLTPFHFYKIELYKGIPYTAILFYNTFYFFFYFLFFLYLIFYNLQELYIIYSSYSIYLIVIASLYIISLLFNLNYIKTFFAYSTIINSLMFIFLIFSFIL